MVFKKFVLLLVLMIQIVGQLEAKVQQEQDVNNGNKLDGDDLEKIRMAMKVSRDCCENSKCCSRRIGKKRSFYTSSFSSPSSSFSQPKIDKFSSIQTLSSDSSSLSSSPLSSSSSSSSSSKAGDLIQKIFADRIKKDELKLKTDLLLRDFLQKRFNNLVISEQKNKMLQPVEELGKEFRSYHRDESNDQERLVDNHHQRSTTTKSNLRILELIQNIVEDLKQV